METLLINEQLISRFKYWREGQMRTGMRFRNNLFDHVAVLARRQRQHAFELAEHLAKETGKQVVVTASPTQYTLWANLRIPSNSLISPLEQWSVYITPNSSYITPNSSSQASLSFKPILSA